MPTVLVAEDDPDVRPMIVLKLWQAGFEVSAFADGIAALAAARTELPDAVVLDVEMPGMSGIDVCRELRADDATRDIAVLLLTGLARDADVLRGLAAGADDYLFKPFSPRDLIERVQAVLDRVGV